jgi:hypothetical protein
MLWFVDQVQAPPVELDFRSSGQGMRQSRAIVAAGIRLINAVGLVEFGPDLTQVQVCEECGMVGCSVGGWIAMRRLGPFVLWLPAWGALEGGAWERSEYTPPSYMASPGPPMFAPAAWSQLRALVPSVPAVDDVPHLNSREVAQLVQWSAPGQVLGRYPTLPKLQRKSVVAVAIGDLQVEMDSLDRLLLDYYSVPGPLEPTLEVRSLRPVDFYLDLPGTPAWTPAGHAGAVQYLLVAGRPAVRRQAG